jgi:release factor glutamine methyltransferase
VNAREALAYGSDRLRQLAGEAGIDTPELDAEVLLRHALGVSREALFAHPERALTAADWAAYQALLARRAAGEPVAYITGHREFMGLDFLVDRHVLIPRPETELLVERALACIQGEGERQVAVDAGTGSGAIAVSLARARPRLRVYATDTSAAALELARANAERLLGPGQAQVICLLGDLLQPVPVEVDLVAANLPYVPTPELNALPRPVRVYEPLQALDGGPDGLDPYRRLLRQVPAYLKAGGVLLMECDPRQAPTLRALAEQALPEATVSIHRDLAGRDRLVEVRRP